MATVSAASTTDAFATMGGVRYQLCITTRISDDAPASLKSEQLQGMVAHTIATWQRAMQAVLTGTWTIAEFGGKVWPSAEEKQGVTVRDNHEPYVTVWNKGGAPINLTVQSWDNGVYALESAKDTLAGLAKFKEHASGFGFDSFEYAALPSPKPAEPAKVTPKPTAKQQDINNVDDYIPPYAQKAVQRHNDIAQAQAPKTAQVKAFIRPAMKGTLPSTLKLQKGAKGKETWEMAIVPEKPYSSNAADFQEKDLLAYPIMGAIRYESSANGFYFVVPVPDSEIRIYQRESTNHNGQLIESDSQKLIKHLGVTGELKQGMKWEVPATHIALKVGKTGEKGQFKNYQGFYELN